MWWLPQNGFTALLHAAWNNREKVVQKLLDAGADPNAKDKVSGGRFRG